MPTVRLKLEVLNASQRSFYDQHTEMFQELSKVFENPELSPRQKISLQNEIFNHHAETMDTVDAQQAYMTMMALSLTTVHGLHFLFNGRNGQQ